MGVMKVKTWKKEGASASSYDQRTQRDVEMNCAPLNLTVQRLVIFAELVSRYNWGWTVRGYYLNTHLGLPTYGGAEQDTSDIR